MVITIKTCKKTQEMMKEFYNDSKRIKTPQYALFQADDGDTVVTLYESGKAVFQGFDADIASLYWQETEKINSGNVVVTNSDKKKEKVISTDNKHDYHNISSIGSDEVGTGDYFGPIVVTSCYVNKNDVPYLESLGVGDSKKISDNKILEMAPKIAKKIKYKSIILSNKEYNEHHKNKCNMNKIKAIMHNKVLYQMVQEEHPEYDYIIVDQFAKEDTYYNYLKESPNIQKNITFMTKAEDKCLSVGCASIISRYLFLKEFDKLSDSLHIPLSKGASTEVDKQGKEIVIKYGKDKLTEVAKLNFNNTEKILND